MKFNKFGVISIIILWIVTLIISFFAGMTYHWASTTEIKTTKDYSQIVVKEDDIADYSVFIDIPEQYKALEQIEKPIRKTISLYMQSNNLKLSEGTHEFTRINGNLDEYINKEFRFEEIANKAKMKQWSSFTAEKTYSYDESFYALQSVDKKEDASYIVVDVYKTENDEKVYSFSPARASDFWGICWEEATYNIWIQSADIGVLCYEYQENGWTLNENAIRPDEIISKYD